MTVPYNPQQNGGSERKNEAIIGVARSMMHDQSLPLYLWVEVSAATVYLQNMSPHKILGKKTPEEVFTGRRPDVEHIRIFGCLTYSHVPSERRTQLDPVAVLIHTYKCGEVSNPLGVSLFFFLYWGNRQRAVLVLA
jgi:hypothetical protein